ncbi:MAG: serine hydrolase [Bacteroidota bacterium]
MIKSVRLAFFVSTCFPLLILGQVPDIVATEGIATILHKNNVGNIFFTNKRIPFATLTGKDFLQSYALTNKSDLFFVAYFDNSLTNYLHRLAPGLTADSLVKKGNYQFTLLVDNKLIYQSNLLPGAPYARIQDTATSINRPLIDNANGTGSWSESFWNRFISKGGDSALTDGEHVLEMQIRPYIKTDTLIVGDILARGRLPVQVLRHPRIDASKISLNEVRPYNGFAVSKEDFDKDKIRLLKANINEGVFKKISSVIVIKNGSMLVEEYFNGANRNTLHDPRSVGKSFASTITGMAIRDGFIKNVEQRLKEFYTLANFSNQSPEKESITIRELLTMSSIFDGDDQDYQSPGNEENMYPTSDWVKFALDLPVKQTNPPGAWHYFTAGVIIMGDILNKQVPGGLETYASRKLFKPLGIHNYKWQYTPQHIPNTAGGIQMNALDFAKYGQLYKNGGTWNQQQIIAKNWVEASFSKQKKIVGRENESYGYLFWNKSFRVGDKSYEAFYAAGNGGNYILVFKDQPLVIVITATAYGQPYAHAQVAKMLSEFILPAVVD